MIPSFLVLADHPASRMRSHVVTCLSYFVPINSLSLLRIDAFIACLFEQASDEDPSVRRHASRLPGARASLGSLTREIVQNVAQYILYFTKDKNENVGLEACEFWLTFAEDAELVGYLQPLLSKIAPILLDYMVYGEDGLLWLEGNANDSLVPHKDSDIKPRHYAKHTAWNAMPTVARWRRRHLSFEWVLTVRKPTIQMKTIIWTMTILLMRCPPNGIFVDVQQQLWMSWLFASVVIS